VSTITSTAIDDHVSVDFVQVLGRHRKDLGDIPGLAASIVEVGLINPITLTRDGRLVAGQRRLEACRHLGWDLLPARFVDNLDDATKLLRAELHENVCRKDMLPSEMASLGAALYEIEAESARKRLHEAQDRGRSTRHGLEGSTRTPVQEERYKTVDAVGEALGIAGRTYQELRYVHEISTDLDAPEEQRLLAREALNAMDHGAGIAGEARRLRGKLRSNREAAEAKAAALAGPEPEPQPGNGAKTSQRGVKISLQAAERRERMREMGRQGYSSSQIAQELGMHLGSVQHVVRKYGIDVLADRALGKSRRRIDPNRVVRETVHALEGLAMGVGLIIDDLNELDPAEVANWATSLTESIRTLNRFVRQIKEMAQ